MNNFVKIGIVSISDRASTGVYEDKGGPTLKNWLNKVLLSPTVLVEKLIPDEQPIIEATLRDLVDTEYCDLILTTGGTGPSRRDVTPEATLAISTRELPGFGERMRAVSAYFVPTAILSRQVAVLRETENHACLIINLPGQPKAIVETLEGLPQKQVEGIFSSVPYCIELIGGPSIETDPAFVRAFRPKSAKRPQIIDAIIQEPQEKANSSIILLHGLGADATDFSSFRNELIRLGGKLENTRMVLPNADYCPISMNNGYPMRAWYDLYSLESLQKEDEVGLEKAWHLVRRLIAEEESRGIPRERILLGGFSQGGCLALYCALKMDRPIGAVFALSSYLPLMHSVEPCKTSHLSPIFLGYGLEDDIVIPTLTQASANRLKELGATQLDIHAYPGLSHFVCEEEIQDFSLFINRVLLDQNV
ncbi:MAG: molybdopterin adenylyltransferase [Burkholderiaceae bacterium]|nr:molybdopterin adenylyltransferase [Burkholderiaceae bacterium]